MTTTCGFATRTPRRVHSRDPPSRTARAHTPTHVPPRLASSLVAPLVASRTRAQFISSSISVTRHPKNLKIRKKYTAYKYTPIHTKRPSTNTPYTIHTSDSCIPDAPHGRTITYNHPQSPHAHPHDPDHSIQHARTPHLFPKPPVDDDRPPHAPPTRRRRRRRRDDGRREVRETDARSSRRDARVRRASDRSFARSHARSATHHRLRASDPSPSVRPRSPALEGWVVESRRV